MVAGPGIAYLGVRKGRDAIGLTASDAARRILTELRRQPPLRVPLHDALGSVLAEAVISPIDIPAHTNSAMDGYAVRGTDVRGATAEKPCLLEVIETLPAGHFPTRAIGPGECARIFTGAPLPQGADTVIRQEDTDRGADRVSIVADRDVGSNVRHAGEDIPRGRRVFEAGVELGPAQLGVLASMAVSHPVVFRRPRVGILGSGDEIVELDQPDEILSGRKVASSNSFTLSALTQIAGGVPVPLGIAADTKQSLREHFANASDCDLLVTSAGVSVGEHDHLRDVVTEVGGSDAIRFWKLRMRPGAPVGFGMIGDMPWLGLPGNPVSAMVTFELFVRPAIRWMAGFDAPFRRCVAVVTGEPIRVSAALQHFLRARITEEGHHRVARLTGPQGSGILTSMVEANGLLIVPEGQRETPKGAPLRALLFDDPMHQKEPGFGDD